MRYKSPIRKSLALNASVGIVIALIAISVEYVFADLFGHRIYLIQIPFVAFASWYWGLTAGLACTITAGMGSLFIHSTTNGSVTFDVNDWIRVVLLMISGAVISFINFNARYALNERDEVSREFGSLFDLSANGMVQADPTTARFLRFNQRFLDLIGYSALEIQNLTIIDITHPADRSETEELLKEMVAGLRDNVRLEKRYIHKLGRIVWVSVEACVVRDSHGRPLRTIAVIEDITQRKVADLALQASERKFRQLTEAMPQMVWISSPTGKVLYFNQRWYAYTGLSKNLAFNEENHCIHADDLSVVATAWNQAYTTSTPYQAECRIRGHDGRYRWFLCRAFPMRDEMGEIIQWIGTCTDIESHRQIEDKLKKAVAARDDFLSIASHELKTPLTALRMQIQMAERQMKSAIDQVLPPEKWKKILSISLKQTDRLTRLVEDLIDVSRIQSGQLTYHFALVDVCELIREITDRLRESDPQAKRCLSVDVPQDPLYVICDQSRLEQVIVNLLSNAFKYANNSEVRVRALINGSDVCISVSDGGNGIPAEKQESIFERFERAGAPTGISGLGLGLFISRQICQSHGGSITVDSEPGMGATFTIRLPLGPVSDATAEVAESISSSKY